MRMKNIFIIAFCFLSIQLFGQSLSIRVTVLDSITNEPLKGASVVVDLRKNQWQTKTDDKGKFTLNMTKDDHSISIKYIGYVPFWIYTTAQTESKDYVIKMRLVENELEQVVISTAKSDQNVKKTLLGVNQINIKTLQKIPAAFGEVDFLRGIQMLPGVSSVGEASNGVNIRGGTTDQNLILIDDTPIFNPTHMFGLFW